MRWYAFLGVVQLWRPSRAPMFEVVSFPRLAANHACVLCWRSITLCTHCTANLSMELSKTLHEMPEARLEYFISAHLLGLITLFWGMPHTTTVGQVQVLSDWKYTPSKVDGYMRLFSSTTSRYLGTSDVYRRIDEAVVSVAGWFKIESVINSAVDAFEQMLKLSRYGPINLIPWSADSVRPEFVNTVVRSGTQFDTLNVYWIWMVREFARQLQGHPVAAPPYVLWQNAGNLMEVINRQLAGLLTVSMGLGTGYIAKMLEGTTKQIAKIIQGHVRNAIKLIYNSAKALPPRYIRNTPSVRQLMRQLRPPNPGSGILRIATTSGKRSRLIWLRNFRSRPT